MAAEYDKVATEFVTYYYNQFDTNRLNLKGLYRADSMLTFEAQGTLGVDAILDKLQNLPFQQIQHRTDTIDAQPAGQDGILVLVTGALLLGGEDKPMSFTQTFQLKQESPGSFYVHNDIFRLVYPAA